MVSERYYIYVKTVKTSITKATIYQVKDKYNKNKMIKEFKTMADARDYKEELNYGK